MILKVHGCYGSEAPGFRSAGFLVNDRLLLEAGTAASVMTLGEQLALSEVCVSHLHLDHIKELAFLVENRCGIATRPLVVAGVAEVVRGLRRHLFNGRVWPDFTSVPSRRNPALAYRILPGGRFSRLAGLAVKPVPVSHPTPAAGLVLREPGTSVLYTGDTGPTAAIWKAARGLRDLKAVIVECSFPDGMEKTALRSGHLTPSLLERELFLFGRPEIPVYVHHMKPQYLPAIVEQIEGLNRRVELLAQGRTYVFS